MRVSIDTEQTAATSSSSRMIGPVDGFPSKRLTMESVRLSLCCSMTQSIARDGEC